MPDLYYRLSDPTDLRDLNEQMAAWTAAGNPKANEWALQPPAPPHDPATQHAPEWINGDWTIRDLTPEEIAARGRKIWPTVADFWNEFSAAEQLAIISSNIAEIKLLDRQLLIWPGQVWSDDERVIAGMNALVNANIISEIRKSEILA